MAHPHRDPGFGYSSMPSADEFDYTFDRLAKVIARFIDAIGLKRYSLYLMDYGAPVGYRLAAQHPERVETLIVQNGNAYEEGLGISGSQSEPTGRTRHPKMPSQCVRR